MFYFVYLFYCLSQLKHKMLVHLFFYTKPVNLLFYKAMGSTEEMTIECAMRMTQIM